MQQRDTARDPFRKEGSGWRRAVMLHAAAHALFWLFYFAFRSAAATSPPPEELSEFPFLLNRILVVACYAAASGVLLAFFLQPQITRFGPWRYVILAAGAVALMPLMQAAEGAVPAFLDRTGTRPPDLVVQDPLIYAFLYGWVLLMWAATQALIDYHRRVVEQARLINRAQALAYDAQLKMLHYQINPHFLFNTLNAISSLVLEKRTDQAERMLLQLSGFLRYSLDRNPNELAPLSAEIDAQRKYLEIEQTRFGDKLAVNFDVAADSARARLPSLILQPILENAIKHAITPRANGGRIDVSAWRDGDLLRVRVEDDGPGLAQPRGGERRGVGLANARERLSVMYGQRAGLIAANRPQGGCAIEFWLPFEQEAILEPSIASSAG